MSKLRVNLGTGSGTCAVCCGKMGKGELRFGKPHSIGVDDWGREVMAGVKYTHLHCFTCKPVARGRSRPAAYLSRIRSRFEGYDALSEEHQKIVRFLHEFGHAEDERLQIIRNAVYCLMGCIRAARKDIDRCPIGMLSDDVARLIGKTLLHGYQSWPKRERKEEKKRRRSDAAMTLRIDAMGYEALQVDVLYSATGALLEQQLRDVMGVSRDVSVRMITRAKIINASDSIEDRCNEGDTVLVAFS